METKPDVQTYDTLLGLLNNYYEPVKSYFASRYAFYNAKQRPDETVAEWGARVKNLASKCNFSTELQIVIRDIFVVGMNAGPIQDRLLEEDASKISITYSQLMEISAAKESTINNKTGWIKEEADFKYQKQSQQAKSAKQSITEKSKCGTCGRSNHTQKECRYKDYSCNICNIKGHLAPMCKKKKGIPIYAANRLQRWAYVLSSFDFEIKYIKSEGNTADFLSRIKTNQCNNNINEYDDAHINFIHEQSPFPLDWHKIKIETKRDPITSRVLHATKTGSWSNDFSINSELNSYNTRKIEITAEQDCLFWGYRVIIPTKFRKSILTELHSCHIGMSSIKSIARSYFWWPSIDKEIKDMARNCNECINARPNPPKSVLTPWKWPQRQWTRVHCDFLGPYKNKTFLIIVDATTKWLEVFQVNSMTAQTVITKLSELIARFGIPRTITTDNTKCFNGDDSSHIARH
ncbi:uncharacterized protein K02A2.6-like [Acyrthosiphon pisum]|uniref:RNA-directed DNA polymerase n=1 Tax=Acyrthosiphon pisum TaxID=7029 RepID=A0A8R2BAW2_ACYPI|nr:uncharacterized protein K02A2.6-like [Acyrthosiphon pisum]